MRQFSADYLEATRAGMWADSRAALEPLALATRERILDVGAGTGELTGVLGEESRGEVVACDADRGLLARAPGPAIQGEATRLPVVENGADLVVCQALLVNLPDPTAAIREFARVSSDLVAAIEPDNSEVTLTSTVGREATLARRARALYLDGVATDATLGSPTREFRDAGLSDLEVRRYDHVRTVEPPYGEHDLEAARRKASGEGLAADRDQILAGEASVAEYEQLREDWRRMGLAVVSQMETGVYR
ncbi:MAG: methyltransferase domain-containing protein, partial [Halapricum sp.]